MYLPFGITIQVYRNTGTDRHGNPLPGTTFTIDQCAHCPRNTSELHTNPLSLSDQRDTVLEGEWLWGPVDADLAPQDLVWLAADDWNQPPPWFVDGDVQRFRNHPFTDNPDAAGFQAVISKVKG